MLNIALYTGLFSLRGTQYGGNGQTNFAPPDLRGRAVVGADAAQPVETDYGNAKTIVADLRPPPAERPPTTINRPWRSPMVTGAPARAAVVRAPAKAERAAARPTIRAPCRNTGTGACMLLGLALPGQSLRARRAV